VMQADVMLVIGANPTDAHPVFASRMKRRLRQGAKLIVIDPRRIDLVRTPHVSAEHHLPLRPGTNVAVLTAMAHVIVTEGLVDEAFIRERCDWDEFQDWARFVSDERHSPEALEDVTGVPAATLREAARLYATGGNGNSAIYYGLGVTEHSQGSSTVMAIANLAMVTGNIGRPGVGVNPLRGQNNVQGACDMGSFPHELSGYRHISDTTPARCSRRTGVWRSTTIRACAFPTCSTPRSMARSARSTSRARISCSPIPIPRHVAAGLAAMDCVIVHDLFLNETANYAHVFLPGSTFLEKDGTFTNAERRIQLVRKVMEPANGYAGLGSDAGSRQAMGLGWNYAHPREIMDEIARPRPASPASRSIGSMSRGLAAMAGQRSQSAGTPVMHVDGFVRGKGKFVRHRLCADRREDRSALSRCC
jgi:formate dehydrogenase major subunit